MPSYNLSGEQIAAPGGNMGCGGNPNSDCSCCSCMCFTGFFIGILVIIVKFGS